MMGSIEHQTSYRFVFRVIGDIQWDMKRRSGTRETLGDLKIE